MGGQTPSTSGLYAPSASDCQEGRAAQHGARLPLGRGPWPTVLLGACSEGAVVSSGKWFLARQKQQLPPLKS